MRGNGKSDHCACAPARDAVALVERLVELRQALNEVALRCERIGLADAHQITNALRSLAALWEAGAQHKEGRKP